MSENARLRRAWEELPKTAHGHQLESRHPDVRPEWIIRVIEAEDSYEWMEYGTTQEGTLRVQKILVGWIPEVSAWVQVVTEENPDGSQFSTAYRLRGKQAEQRLRGQRRRNRN